MLPQPVQTWSHCTTSHEKLNRALGDPSVTAIESDILMGYVITEGSEINNDEKEVPIMAHPPSRQSNLSVRQFLCAVSNEMDENYEDETQIVSNASVDGRGAPRKIIHSSKNIKKRRNLKKHIKLDFKHMEAVRPTLRAIEDLQIEFNGCSKSTSVSSKSKCERKTIFLNADILPGPGMRNVNVGLDGQEFLNTCLKQAKTTESLYSFSLGWSVDPRAFYGYTDYDIQAMMNLIQRYELTSSCNGIVFAVNARVLVLNCSVFDRLLNALPECQLLVWTGTGEPPVSSRKVRIIQSHFCKKFPHRIGFDCQVAPLSWSGFLYDFFVALASPHFYFKKWINSKNITNN